MGGVYSITNIVNGKRYIGSAINFNSRWKGHQKSMIYGSSNKKLQNAYRKHGINNFLFEPLLICAKENLLFYEEKAIAAFDSVDNGYNCRRIPYSNIGLKLPKSEETKRKIGAANKGKLVGRRSHMLGKKQTAESRKKMSVSKRLIFRKYTLHGEAMCLSDWADKIGITVRALGNRLRRGWPLERALTEKSRGY